MVESVVLVKPTNERVNEKIIWDVTVGDKTKNTIYGKRILIIDKQMENGSNFVIELFWQMEGVFQSIQDEAAWSEVKSLIIEATREGNNYINNLIFNNPLSEYRTNIDAKGRALAIKLQRIDEMKKMYFAGVEANSATNLEDTLSFEEIDFNNADALVQTNPNTNSVMDGMQNTVPFRENLEPAVQPFPASQAGQTDVKTSGGNPINDAFEPVREIFGNIAKNSTEPKAVNSQQNNSFSTSPKDFDNLFQKVDVNEYQNILNEIQQNPKENENLPMVEPISNAVVPDSIVTNNPSGQVINNPIPEPVVIPVNEIPFEPKTPVISSDLPQSNMSSSAVENNYATNAMQQEMVLEMKRHDSVINEIIKKYTNFKI